MGTLRWFGRAFDSPMYEDMPRTPAPIGETCTLCQEPILEGEPGITMPHIMTLGVQIRPQHIECHLRSVVGSPAHLDGECSCVSGERQQGHRHPRSPRSTSYREEAREVIERFWGKDWKTRG